MAKRFLKYDTKNCPGNVDKNGVLTGGGGSKERILFFENVEFGANNKYSYTFDELGVTELVKSLDVTDGNYVKIFDKYRMVFYIDGRIRTVFEYDMPTPSDSGFSIQSEVFEIRNMNSTPLPLFFTYDSAYGGQLSIPKMSGTTFNSTVTCYLEEL